MNDKIQETEVDDLSFLLDSSYPLLKKLREIAPGTYKHSQTVEAMIEGVAAAVKLNPIKMKVVALYHDIGKIANPYLFTENQLEEEDPHKDIPPFISAQLIRAHVPDSTSILLADHNFPRELIEVISQHHGNSVIQYFFDKSGGKEMEVDKFRHKGPRPANLESMILMITDQVEAVSRSFYQHKTLDPKEVIEFTIQRLLDDGQLDKVYLQLGDLKKVKIALAKELQGMYQKRVDYDTAKTTKKE